MSASRTYECPPWPEGGYPDWPPVKARLQEEFKHRFAYLESDLFREAFWLSRVPPTAVALRADLVKGISPSLILYHNRGLVWKMTCRPWVGSQIEPEEIMAEVTARVMDPDAPRLCDELLCAWHDALVGPSEADVRKARYAVIRRVLALSEILNQDRPLTLDPVDLAATHQQQEDGERTDDPRMRTALQTVWNRSDTTTRLVVEMFLKNDKKLKEVRAALLEQNIKLKLPALSKRAAKFISLVQIEYKLLRDGERK